MEYAGYGGGTTGQKHQFVDWKAIITLMLLLIAWLTCDCVRCSLFAAEALESSSHQSTTSIYGCDVSRVMSLMAVDIVRQSRFSRLIHVINKNSMELQCPQDLHAKSATACLQLLRLLWPPYVIGAGIIFLPSDFYLLLSSSSFFFFLA